MAYSRYFYHSFPRASGIDATPLALKTIESVIDRGLLLSPERIEFREELANGTLSKPWYAMQKRISFTELEPCELIQHAKTFGPFSFEWDIPTLMQMGAIPVFYVPLKSVAGANEALACSMLARLGEVQELLARLEKLESLVRQTANPVELLSITNNGIPIAQTRCTIGGASDILHFLQIDIQPISKLTGAIRGLSGFFYPTDNEQYTEPLGYYRQREWRLIADVFRLETPVTVPVTDEDIEALLLINREFFSRELDFSTGRKTRVSECQLYKIFQGAPIVQTIRKLICPKSAMSEVDALLKAKNVVLDTVALEEYGII